MGNEERNLLVRVAATCRILADDLAKLPDNVADDRFVGELRDVCERAAGRLDELARGQGGAADGRDGSVAEGH